MCNTAVFHLCCLHPLSPFDFEWKPSGIPTYGRVVLTLDSRLWIFVEHFVHDFSSQPAKIITILSSQKTMFKICLNGTSYSEVTRGHNGLSWANLLPQHAGFTDLFFARETSSLFQSAVKNSSSLTPLELQLLILAFSTGVIPGLDHRQYTRRISSGFLLLMCFGWRAVFKE